MDTETDTTSLAGNAADTSRTHILSLVRLTETGAHFGIDRRSYHGPQATRGGIEYTIFPMFKGDDPKVRIGRDVWVELGRPGRVQITVEALG